MRRTPLTTTPRRSPARTPPCEVYDSSQSGEQRRCAKRRRHCPVLLCPPLRSRPSMSSPAISVNPDKPTHTHTHRQADRHAHHNTPRSHSGATTHSRLRSEPTNYSQQNIFEALKIQDQKMQVLEMKDQISRLESAFSSISSLLVYHFQVRRFQSTHFSHQIKSNGIEL